MDKETKQEIIKKYQRSANDVGSVEVQCAILTQRITELTEHMKIHKKDNSSRRGLIAMVNKRRKLLNYLQRADHARYSALVNSLKLLR